MSNKLYKILGKHEDDVTCLENIDDDIFASGSGDKSIKIWNYIKG